LPLVSFPLAWGAYSPLNGRMSKKETPREKVYEEAARDPKAFIKLSRRFARPYRVSNGKKFRLKHFNPADTGDLVHEDKPSAKQALAEGVLALAELQERLYAQDQWAVLLIFQAPDAAGKDSAVKHVMSGVNPQGCEVHSFKAPSNEELEHDFLWRSVRTLPRRGNIGIFNRSYYEEVLVVRVHPQYLAAEKLPPQLVTKHIWKDRFKSIRNFEKYLAQNGVLVRKFFLNVSKKEQKKRFLERLNKPSKHWKFNPEDLAERNHWDEYQKAYEEMIRETATEESPWYIVPADNKWYTRVVVASAVVEALDSLDLKYPKVTRKMTKQLAASRRKLEKE
jgi:PPK2 family polyphosphate:nucleotide phosphotransferase